VRWRDITGAITGDEHTIDFADTHLFPPSDECNAVEIYVKGGSEYTIQVQEGGEVIDLQQYYTKAEVQALIADIPPYPDRYDNEEITDLLEQYREEAISVSRSDNNYIKETDFSVINYYGINEPSNAPTNSKWRQIDANENVLMDWVKQASGWKSLRYQLAPFVSSGSLSATGSAFAVPDTSMPFDLLVTQFVLNYQYPSATTANYWRAQVFRQGSETNVETSIVSLTDLNKTATTNWKALTTNLNPGVANTNLGHWRLALTKMSSAATISFNGYLKYHWTR
jgi:hypothetical protein